jgi:hypothetical protein
MYPEDELAADMNPPSAAHEGEVDTIGPSA